MRSSTAGIDLDRLVKYKIISSAYNEILFLVFPMSIPVISSLARKASVSGSIARLNKNGDSGHPCRQPLYRPNFSVRVPFMPILACRLLYMALIHPMHFSPRLNFSKTANKYDHSTLSNAFSASSDIIRACLLRRVEWSIIFNSLRILSAA